MEHLSQLRNDIVTINEMKITSYYELHYLFSNDPFLFQHPIQDTTLHLDSIASEHLSYDGFLHVPYFG